MPSPALGIVEHFRPGEHERVERVLQDLRELRIEHLRTGFSWADWHSGRNLDWYRWLLPRLARDVQVVPCFTTTPPEIGIVRQTSAPPRDPKAYADFLDVVITELGGCFEFAELWNVPNNISDWDWRLDPSWHVFCQMIGGAAYWVRQRGKKTVLPGMTPTDPKWLDLLCSQGVMQYVDVVGVRAFPGTWDFEAESWPQTVAQVQEVLARHKVQPEVWVTETGYATWRHDEHRQVVKFVEALGAPASRVYWYCAHDLSVQRAPRRGAHQDQRHYHLGLRRGDGKPKLLYRVLAEEGVVGAHELAALALPAAEAVPTPQSATVAQEDAPAHEVPARRRARPAARASSYTLITGGAGFIGTNLAHHLSSNGESVLVLDNLSRPGVDRNLRWLYETHGERLQVRIVDIRDEGAVADAVAGASAVFHFAAQVAVTHSLENPLEDFAVNLRGTMNVLEAMRLRPDPPPLLFTSTNKVYGDLAAKRLVVRGERWVPVDERLQRGFAETWPLDFHSPYGCSKGAADEYVLDYARSFGLPAVVFRMSCIYGPHQCGSEDQGWVAHFLAAALRGETITLYGDGRQVRDLLFVDDLVAAMLLARKNAHQWNGRAFNIGGGTANAASLLEVLDRIGELCGRRLDVRHGEWRRGDQKFYVSDTSAFTAHTGWTPRVSVEEGLRRLHDWLVAQPQVGRQPIAAGAVPALPAGRAR